jgi:hypothetical protein
MVNIRCTLHWVFKELVDGQSLCTPLQVLDNHELIGEIFDVMLGLVDVEKKGPTGLCMGPEKILVPIKNIERNPGTPKSLGWRDNAYQLKNFLSGLFILDYHWTTKITENTPGRPGTF